jgi:chorismate mutase
MTEQHKDGKAPKSGRPRKPAQGSREFSGKSGNGQDRGRKPGGRPDDKSGRPEGGYGGKYADKPGGKYHSGKPGGKYSGKPGDKYAGKPGGKYSDKPGRPDRPGDKYADKPGDKPGGKYYSDKPGDKPGGKYYSDKPGDKPGGKYYSDKSGGKPGGRNYFDKPGKPGGKYSGKPGGKYADKSGRPGEGAPREGAGAPRGDERKPYRRPGAPDQPYRKPGGGAKFSRPEGRDSRPERRAPRPGEEDAARRPFAPAADAPQPRDPAAAPRPEAPGAFGPAREPRPGQPPREGRGSRGDEFPRRAASGPRGGAGDFRKPGGRPQSLTQELVDLEFELANLLARRTALLGRSAKARVDKGLPLADPNQERALRRAWDVVAGREGLEVPPLRGIFTLANGLAYAHATKPEIGRKAFYLSPRAQNVDLTVAGPRSLVRTRLWAAVAAAAGADCVLAPVVLNDPLVELVKALNQAGAGLSWEQDTVRNQGGAPKFADRTVFAGSDPLNLYLLLALALPQVGRMTFTGGAALKVHDLGPAAGVFAGLGARLTSIEPYAPGLPARLESGGMTHNAFCVPDALPAEAAVALALAGPTYPQGIRFTWGPQWSGAPMLAHAAALLRACGVPCELTDGSFAVARAALAVPAAPAGADLPLDPLLAASLLAVPRAAGGRVALGGAWADDDPLAPAARALLAASGLELDFGPTVAVAQAGPWPEAVELDATDPALVPLAVALGLAAPGDARIRVAEDADTATAEIVAERAGRFARVKPGRIVIVPGQGAGEWADSERRMSSPSPAWTLALALVSLRVPNIGLANPGGLAEVWPGFISLLADNFSPRKKEPESDDGKKKGRRVRLD